MGGKGWMIGGAILLLLGIGAFLVEGVGYVTEEEVLDVGPIEVTAEREETVGVPPWVGGVLIGAGAVLLVVGFAGSGRKAS